MRSRSIIWGRFARNVVKWDFLSDFKTLWLLVSNNAIKSFWKTLPCSTPGIVGKSSVLLLSIGILRRTLTKNIDNTVFENHPKLPHFKLFWFTPFYWDWPNKMGQIWYNFSCSSLRSQSFKNETFSTNLSTLCFYWTRNGLTLPAIDINSSPVYICLPFMTANFVELTTSQAIFENYQFLHYRVFKQVR